MNTENFLTVKDFASNVGVNPQRIYLMIRLGELEYQKLGNAYMIPRHETEGWISKEVGKRIWKIKTKKPN